MTDDDQVAESSPIFELREVGVVFGVGTRRRVGLRGVNLTLSEGEAIGVAGRSGSGKTTLARTATGLLRASSGTVTLEGIQLATRRGWFEDRLPAPVQMVFQDPLTALNPRVRVGQLLSSALARSLRPSSIASVEQLLNVVGLHPDLSLRLPAQLSGGECQRVCIASALALGASALVLDEPTTMLDWPSRCRITDLLQDLRKQYGLAVMILSHDLDLLIEMCDSLLILDNGKIIERGEVRRVTTHPSRQETRRIVEATSAMREAALRSCELQS